MFFNLIFLLLKSGYIVSLYSVLNELSSASSEPVVLNFFSKPLKHFCVFGEQPSFEKTRTNVIPDGKSTHGLPKIRPQAPRRYMDSTVRTPVPNSVYSFFFHKNLSGRRAFKAKMRCERNKIEPLLCSIILTPKSRRIHKQPAILIRLM